MADRFRHHAAIPASDSEVVELRGALRLVRGQLVEREQEVYDLRQENEELRAKVDALQSRIEHMCRRIYGWSSERQHPGQQYIDFGVPGILPDQPGDDTSAAATTSMASASQDAIPSSRASAVGPSVPKRRLRKPGSHPGRRRLPDNAEVVQTDLDVPAAERLDVHGCPLPLLGWRISDKWDYRPGTYLIRRFRRAIYGRPFSAAQDRIVAAMPDFLIPRGQMTDAAVIHTVVEKFADHLPLYRQAARAERRGIALSRSTLVNHVAAVAGAMEPIVASIAASVRVAPMIHMDDTPVRVLDPGRGHTATARIWVYRSANAVVFRYTPTREGRHPAEFLGDYRGYIVADAYAGHERLYGPGKATHVACWAHVRRKFYEIGDRSALAWSLVEDIRHLYRIEDDIRDASPADRHRIRHERSRPHIDRMAQRLDQERRTALPASDLGKAIDYAWKRWPQLNVYLQHDWLPIDNNPAENALRPWAYSRKTRRPPTPVFPTPNRLEGSETGPNLIIRKSRLALRSLAMAA